VGGAGKKLRSRAHVLSQGDDLPTARELYHAALGYKRPVGNRDPDTDPTSAVTLAPLVVH